MDEDEKKEWAAALIASHNREFEYCLVYEDDDLIAELEEAGLDYEEMEPIFREIHDLMYKARIKVFIDGNEYE